MRARGVSVFVAMYLQNLERKELVAVVILHRFEDAEEGAWMAAAAGNHLIDESALSDVESFRLVCAWRSFPESAVRQPVAYARGANRNVIRPASSCTPCVDHPVVRDTRTLW